MDAIVFRDAIEADIPALVALVTSAYRGDASRAGWTTEADLLDGNRIDPDVLRGDILRPGSRVLLAERDGILLGCAHVGIEDGAGYFGMFAIRPDLQGAGLGKRLLAGIRSLAGHHDCLGEIRGVGLFVGADIVRDGAPDGAAACTSPTL